MDLLKYSIYYFLFSIFVISLVLQLIVVLFTSFERIITVQSKEGYGSQRGRNQLVMDQDGRVYSVSNAIILLHFTSAEVFSGIAVGKRYKVKGYGLRVPVFGIFPNITSATNA